MTEMKNEVPAPVSDRQGCFIVTAKGLESEETIRQRAEIRKKVDGVADAQSREGIVSDVLGVIVVGLSQLTVALSKAKTLADVNAAAQPLADIGAAVDASVKSGALKLPYMVKTGGAQGVLADMTKLSNGVAAVFAAAQPPAKSGT